MVVGRMRQAIFWIALSACGCSSTGGQLGTLQTQNRSLIEQNKAQLAEMENLKTHARRLEDKLIEAERRLAAQEREENRRLAANEEQPRSAFDEPDDEPADGGNTASAKAERRR